MSGYQKPIVTEAAIRAALRKGRLERSRVFHAALAWLWRAPARLVARQASRRRARKAACGA